MTAPSPPFYADRAELRRLKLAAVRDPASLRRSLRFAQRQLGKALPAYSDLAQLPDWAVDDDRRDAISRITVLLHYRRQIDKEISGRKLAQLAEVFGESYFDLACSAPRPDDSALAADITPMPRPDIMLIKGRKMLDQHRDSTIGPLVSIAEALYQNAVQPV
jgi:hypothetical protein